MGHLCMPNCGALLIYVKGNNMCPCRHFAQTEMQSLVALFVAGFEIESAECSQYVPPPFVKKKIPIFHSVIRPASDVEVNLRRRVGYEDTEWVFEM